MANATATVKHQGLEIPAPGTWAIDGSHSSVGFVARHLMVSKVRGSFERVAGTIHVDEDPQSSWAEVEIDAASITTGEPGRDEHLRSPDFLDVATYPKLSFRSTGVESVDGDRLKLRGDLTIRNTTREVVLDVEYLGVFPDMQGGTRAGFSASTVIDRGVFGITWNAALETGGVLVGNKVRVELEVAAVRS